MKTIRIMAAVAASLLLAGACTHEQQMTTEKIEKENEIKLIDNAEDSPSYGISYSIEYITGGVKKEVMDMINSSIADFIYTEEDQSFTVPEACEVWESNCISQYEAEKEGLDEDFDPESAWTYNWSSDISGTFSTRCEARNWQTYVFGGSDYMGGAHPFSYASYTVFDMKTGEIVRENDFLDTENEDLWELLYQRVLEGDDEESLTDEDLFELPTFNNNFRVDDNGVTWLYNAYEIAAYVYGPIEATLTWEELAPYLKK